MTAQSLLRRAAVFALATAGCAVPALAPNVANASVRGVSSACVYAGGCRGFAGYSGQTWDYAPPNSGSATTTFVVPKLRCGTADQAIAPSVSAFMDDAGRPTAAALFVGCHTGKAHYWPELVLNGRVKNYRAKTAHAGDTIVLRLAYGHKRHWVSVTDETHKFKVSRTSGGGTLSAAFETALIGDEGWANWHHHLQGAPDFGTLTYSNSQINGEPLGHVLFLSRAVNRTSAGKLQIKTGPLFSGGKAFRTYFKQS